jgi:hypothetical protein
MASLFWAVALFDPSLAIFMTILFFKAISMLASKVVIDVSGVEAAGTFGDIELDATVAFTPAGASTIIAVVPAEFERGGTSSSFCISWSALGEAKTNVKGFPAKTRYGKKATAISVKTIMRQYLLIIFFHSM